MNAKYCFCVVDNGSDGSTSDGGTLANSTFGQALIGSTLQFLYDALLVRDEHLEPQSYVFVANEAFSLRRKFMKYFPKASYLPGNMVFNYRLPRARMIIEKATGILSSQWHIDCQGIGMNPENVDICV